MEWKRLFRDIILDRGFIYYQDYAVEDLTITSDTIEATVLGTVDYNVNIYYKDNQILDMECNCPYAMEGNNCKHMVAVLYEWEEKCSRQVRHNYNDVGDDELYIEYHRSINTFEDAKKLVEKADIEIVKDFLASILKDNDSLFTSFKGAVEGGLNMIEKNRLKIEIDEIVRANSTEGKYVNYRNVECFVSELDDFMYENIQPLIETKQYLEAFNLVAYIFDTTSELIIDDCLESANILGDIIYDYWERLDAEADIPTKLKMFDWFIEKDKVYMGIDLGVYIENAIVNGFKEEDFIERRKEYIYKHIEGAECGYSHHPEEIEPWAVIYLEVLLETKAPLDEVASFCKKHWQFIEIRDYCIRKCIQNKQFEQALKIIDESLEIVKGCKRVEEYYAIWKKEIFKQLDNKKAFRDELEKIATEYNIDDIKAYRELKRAYTKEEWPEVRDRVLLKISNKATMHYYYKEERMYDKLLECVMISKTGLQLLEYYEQILAPLYPKQILKKEEEYIYKKLEVATSRGVYRQIADKLNWMKQIKGGKDVVNNIVRDLRFMYKRRTALISELNKAALY